MEGSQMMELIYKNVALGKPVYRVKTVPTQDRCRETCENDKIFIPDVPIHPPGPLAIWAPRLYTENKRPQEGISMRKLSAVLMLTGFLLSLTACTDNVAEQSRPQQVSEANREVTFQAKIVAIKDNALLVEPAEGSPEAVSAGQISIPLAQVPSVPEPQNGDMVEITYNGDIMESSPAQLGVLYDIHVITQAEPGNFPDENEGPSEQTISYEYQSVYLSVSLPDTWNYRIRPAEEMQTEEDYAVCAIDFWPAAFPQAVFELAYYQSFGMCGTGVTVEEITLPGGLSGHRYKEQIEDTLWLTIIFRQENEDPSKNGCYVILPPSGLSMPVWEQVEGEFEQILQSVQTKAADR